MRQKLLDFVAQKGTLLEPDAADYLLRQSNPIERLASIIGNFENVPLVITLGDILQADKIAIDAATRLRTHEHARPILQPRPRMNDIFPARAITAKAMSRQSEPSTNYEEDLVVLRDITGNSISQGKIEDFSKYFLSRYKTLSSLLLRQRQLSAATSIAKAKRMVHEFTIVGMVSEMRKTKNGHKMVDLEDETDKLSVLLPADSPAFEVPIVTDQVIGVTGTVSAKGLLVANAIIQPDIPASHQQPLCADNVSVAFISDLHVGSKSFLDTRWEGFQNWISNGDEMAKSIKYIIVGGDLVDGIGVYPRQDEDLSIDDIYAQYEMLAQLISRLPSRIKIVLVPGNHDAVRPAEPQPALQEGVRKLFPSNVLCVGNPCLLRIHGVKVLMYHGRSMDDLVSAIPSLSYSRPLEPMVEMLKMRHLAPIYGGRTPIAPEAQDLLAIEEVPDIFVTGHVHGVGLGDYRRVTLINSSAWQSQTSYQKMRNLEPVPAMVPITNLSTMRTTVKEF